MDQRITQRDDVQGLRAIAVIAVVLFHANKSWLPGGFVGVDIFLVISGFLITSIVLRQRSDQTFSLLSFYESRLRRIVPAYFVLLALVSLSMAILLVPKDFAIYEEGLKNSIYFNSNSFFANHHDYFAPASHEMPLLHTWSLAIEMQFYLLLPIGIIYIPQRYRALALTLSCAGLFSDASLQLLRGAQQPIYFSLAARIPEFLIGSLLATQQFRWNSSRLAANLTGCLGLLIILASFLHISENSVFPGWLALAPCLGAALIIAAQHGVVNRTLASAPLIWLGAISYSLYLWHWPILAGTRYFFETYVLSALALMTFVVATLILSYASYRFIEIPFRNEQAVPLKSRRLAALLLLLPTSIGVAHAINSKIVAPLPEQLTRYASASDICHGQIIGDCLHGDKLARRTLLLLGDSHAAQLNHFADVVGKSISAKIHVISASSCVTIPGFDVERIPEWARGPCLSQIEQAKPLIHSADSLLLAGKWEYHYQSSRFMVALNTFLAEAQARHQQVIVLAQVPMLTSNVQRTHRLNSLGLTSEALVDKGWIAANKAIRTVVSRYYLAEFLDMSGDKLFADVPLNMGVLVYSDKQHLNEVGSQMYGRIAIPHLSRLVGRDR